MGVISIAAFRPRPGKQEDLFRVLADRITLMRRLGFVTAREPVNCRARSGVILHISEWGSEDAIERAHRTPEVLALWERFAACCDYVRLDTLAESREDFATFEAIDR